MTTKAKAINALIDAIVGEDVPMGTQTVSGNIKQLADGIADGSISIGGGAVGVSSVRIDDNTNYFPDADAVNTPVLKELSFTPANVQRDALDALPDDAMCIGVSVVDTKALKNCCYSATSIHYRNKFGEVTDNTPVGKTAGEIKTYINGAKFGGFAVDVLVFMSAITSAHGRCGVLLHFA